ncbi:hypothetical protein D9M71_237640 [compost metagenome]
MNNNAQNNAALSKTSSIQARLTGPGSIHNHQTATPAAISTARNTASNKVVRQTETFCGSDN